MRSSSRWIRPVSECAVAHTCALAAPAAPAPHAAGAPPCLQTAHRAGGAEGRRAQAVSWRYGAPHSARRGDLVAAGAGRISHLGTLCAGGAEAVEVRRPLMRATPRALPTAGGAAPVAHAPAVHASVAPIAPAPVAVTSAARMPAGRACVGAAHRGYIVMSRAAVARQWRLVGHPHHGDSCRRARSVSWRYGASHSARRGDLVAAGAGRISHLGTLCTGGAEDSRTRSASWRYGAQSGADGRGQTVSWRYVVRGVWGGCRGIAGGRGKIVAAEPWYMVREGVYIGVGGHRPVFGSRCGSPGAGRRSAKRRCE